MRPGRTSWGQGFKPIYAKRGAGWRAGSQGGRAVAAFTAPCEVRSPRGTSTPGVCRAGTGGGGGRLRPPGLRADMEEGPTGFVRLSGLEGDFSSMQVRPCPRPGLSSPGLAPGKAATPHCGRPGLLPRRSPRRELDGDPLLPALSEGTHREPPQPSPRHSHSRGCARGGLSPGHTALIYAGRNKGPV